MAIFSLGPRRSRFICIFISPSSFRRCIYISDPCRKILWAISRTMFKQGSWFLLPFYYLIMRQYSCRNESSCLNTQSEANKQKIREIQSVHYRRICLNPVMRLWLAVRYDFYIRAVFLVVAAFCSFLFSRSFYGYSPVFPFIANEQKKLYCIGPSHCIFLIPPPPF